MLWLVSLAVAGSLNGYQTAYFSTPGLYMEPRQGGWAGDIDGDGTSELWTGAGYAVLGAWRGGVIEVFHGTSARGSNPWAWFIGQGQNANFGQNALFGDVNGDGEVDALIGESGSLPGQPYYVLPPPRVYVWLGPLQGGAHMASSADVVLEATDLCEATFGPLLPDVTGDGVSDLVVALHTCPAIPTQTWVVDMSHATRRGPRVRAIDASVRTRVEGDVPGEFRGPTRLLGDLDQDGLPEIAFEDTTGNDTQRWVIDGVTLAAGGVSSVAAVGRGLFRSGPVNAAGDIDGDGLPDVIITSEGGYDGARILRGPDIMAIPPGQIVQESLYADLLAMSFWGPVSEAIGVGDINGDGFNDWAMGLMYTTTDFVWGLPTGPGSVWIGFGDGTISLTDGMRDAVGERFTSPVLLPGIVAPWLAAGEDCDGDQLPDLLVPAEAIPNSRWVMLCY